MLKKAESRFLRSLVRTCGVAIESAQDAGLDLDAVGSGVAREQSPLPGTHVAAGSRITVHFGKIDIETIWSR